MPPAEPLIRTVADTARWVAYYRAVETDRPDALFRDRFARALAGERGARIAQAMTGGRLSDNPWPFTARTVLMDDMLLAEIAAGADMVINLAAGLDARPYRLALPPTLTWVEVDTDSLITEKEELLRNQPAACRVERHRRDLTDAAIRKRFFAELAPRTQRAVVLSEGLVMYLDPADVDGLARDLAAIPAVRSWILDMYHPRILRTGRRGKMGRMLAEANAQFRFAPPEGLRFFEPAGWAAAEIRSTLLEAKRMGRLSWFLRLMVSLFERGPEEAYSWSAVCRLKR
jgi:methyltransferase (TIGR00027 family)